MRKCLSHLGQTFRLSSMSFFQMIWRQLSHLIQSPSVRTFFSPEVSSSPDSRLNHVIRSVFYWPLALSRSRCAKPQAPVTSWPTANGERPRTFLIFNSSLRHYAFFVRVLDLTHFCNRVCHLDDGGMRIASR